MPHSLSEWERGRAGPAAFSHAPCRRGPYAVSPHTESICIISGPNDANISQMRQIKVCPGEARRGASFHCLKLTFGSGRIRWLGAPRAYRCVGFVPVVSHKNDARLTSACDQSRAGVCLRLFVWERPVVSRRFDRLTCDFILPALRRPRCRAPRTGRGGSR